MKPKGIDKKAVIALFNSGISGGEIAKQLGVSRQRISQIIRWATLNPMALEGEQKPDKEFWTDTKLLEEKMFPLYERGVPIHLIAKVCNTSYTKAYELLSVSPCFSEAKTRGDKKKKVEKWSDRLRDKGFTISEVAEILDVSQAFISKTTSKL